MLTLFAFSTENWGRPRTEVDYLLRLAGRTIDRELAKLDEKGIRLQHIGDLASLPKALRHKVEGAIARTASNDRMIVNLAFNYGGRADVVQAVRRLIAEGARPEDVTEEAIACRLQTTGLPRPGPAGAHGRGASHLELPGLAGGVRGVLLHPRRSGPTSDRARSTRRCRSSAGGGGASAWCRTAWCQSDGADLGTEYLDADA